MMVVLMVLTVVCLLNSLVLLGHQLDSLHTFAATVDMEKQHHHHPNNHYDLDNNIQPRYQRRGASQRKTTSKTSNGTLNHSSRLRDLWESTHTYKAEPEERAKYPTISIDDYDINDCPKSKPPLNYPSTFAAKTVLAHWNVDDLQVPTDYHYGSLCVLDWRRDYETIQIYRKNEVPFVVMNHPEVYKTVQRWKSDDYLTELIGDGKPQRTEHSPNNHLMYWRSRGDQNPKDFVPPTEDILMSFTDWKQKADQIAYVSNAKDEPHWYLRYNAEKTTHNPTMYDELPFFNTDGPNADFMVDKRQERGINCRFGMAGGIAEAHFDPTRNWIVLLGGTGPRRYILAHPSQCSKYMLYPLNHPSGRHASINWSTEYETEPFASAQLLETVLQVSDALYLPTSWLHFIVSLGTNYQCNARSGVSTENHHFIEDCGFTVPR
jgi:Cupin-like domain